MDDTPHVGVIVQSEPGEPPAFLHTHTVTVITGLMLPAHDEPTYRRIVEMFADPACVEQIQHALTQIVGRSVPALVQTLLEGRHVVFESSLKRFMTKPKPEAQESTT